MHTHACGTVPSSPSQRIVRVSSDIWHHFNIDRWQIRKTQSSKAFPAKSSSISKIRQNVILGHKIEPEPLRTVTTRFATALSWHAGSPHRALGRRGWEMQFYRPVQGSNFLAFSLYLILRPFRSFPHRFRKISENAFRERLLEFMSSLSMYRTCLSEYIG